MKFDVPEESDEVNRQLEEFCQEHGGEVQGYPGYWERGTVCVLDRVTIGFDGNTRVEVENQMSETTGSIRADKVAFGDDDHSGIPSDDVDDMLMTYMPKGMSDAADIPTFAARNSNGDFVSTHHEANPFDL